MSTQEMYNGKSDTYFSGERKEVLPFLPEKFTRLLDVGCGSGEFGALVKKNNKNAEIWGVDINAAAIESAKTKIDHALFGSFSADIILPDHYFDVITFNDSLEHFPDPLPILNLCKQKLVPNGRIVCSLPNVRYLKNVFHLLIDMDWKYSDYGILDYTHLRFFTKKSMVRLFEENGFIVDSINGINSLNWSSKKIFLLRLFFRKYVEDMRYLEYVVVSRL